MLLAGKAYMLSLPREQAKRVLGVFLVMLAIAMFVIGRLSSPTPVLMQQAMAEMQLEILQQQEMLEQIAREQETNINALAVRLAELQASSTRLDALGERLVQLGKLDPEEFDFNQPPPVGGPEQVISDGVSSVMDMSQSINWLSEILASQYARLDALQLLLLDRNLEAERTPAGWPVSSGWISSGFGERNDPFTGKRARHNGLDFAGIKGSEVLGVASGVVIWSGPRQGYGKLLEIDHGNGYITRYAHNDELLVKAGDGITAGQQIAKMGATGRASSPHVHFEVLYKGQHVNPYKFVKQMR
ncbi:MAG: M23 family metallopeptidase [Xanthomonadales bacterium]|nr:M23 family metallopeptidase [Gammaproteobacteria bacterium]NNK03718.1 M23 family metallopeptidase [Xanthomonadales bacterium]